MLNPRMSRGSTLPLGPIWVMDITPDANYFCVYCWDSPS